MRDALGGTVVIAIIAVFIALVSAYMAFQVNYTKAFRMKNKIINIYEKYYGQCFSSNVCDKEIKDYADSLGYSPHEITCSNDSSAYKSKTGSGKLYCAYQYKADKVDANSLDDKGQLYYYKIYTVIDIRIPVLDNLLGRLNVFQTTGDTKVMDLNNYEGARY